MVRSPAVRTLAVVVILLASFLSPVSAANLHQAEAPPGEPNDSFGSASPLEIGSTWSGAIFPRGDLDWYAFTVDHQGELQVTLSAVPANLDMVFRVWNANKDVISDWFAPLKQGGDTQGIIDLAEAGRYYLEVRDGSDDADSDQPYTLSTVFTPTVDENEPNNSFGAATALGFGAPMPATILPRGDVDWYHIDVDEHGELAVAITGVPANLDMVFRVWNSNRDVISNWFAPLKQGGDTLANFDLPTAGRYFLEVHDGNDDGRSVQPYTLTATITSSADLFESDNAFGAAAALKVGETISATILPAGDVDWFVFSVPHHGELSLSVTQVSADLAVFVRIWNGNKDVISDWFRPLAKGGDTLGTFDLPAAGAYYLEVAGDSGQRAIQPFGLRVDFIAAADAFEPNNSFGRAAELGVDRSVQANILPAGDVDWFYFDVAQAGELSALITGVDPEMAVFYRVWNANKDVISDWFRPLAKGGDTEGAFDLATPGRYYLEVIADSGQRAIQPYTLQLGYAASADTHEPNSTLATAAPIGLDQTVVGDILPAGDVDWYQFVTPAAGDLYVWVTHVAPELSITFRLWDANQSAVSDWFSSPEPGQDASGAISVTAPMTYFVELRAGNGNMRSSQPYWLLASMQPIDPATIQPPGPEVEAPAAGEAAAPVAPGQTKTVTVPVDAGKVTILTSGQIGPLGGELFVSGKPGQDGARLTVPPGALDALTTIDIAVTADWPQGGPFGLQPAGSYWVFTPAGLQFKQPVTVTLPAPTGAASADMFIGRWDGAQWVDLDGTVADGLITAPTSSFSQFGVFCGRLDDYAQVTMENASGSPTLNLVYLSGPSPDPDNPDAFIAGCPTPYAIVTSWELQQGDMASMLLRPGVYAFNVAYPQPQPGVANNLFVTIPPGGGQQTIRITDDGATSDNPQTKITFPGRQIVAGSNVRPIVACSAEAPAGVGLANADPGAAALPSRIVVISQMKLEQFPPKGTGIRFTATATDPENSQLRTFWTRSGGLGKSTTAGDPVASGAPIEDQFTFQPSHAGSYTVFLTVYDDLGLFDECRWVIDVQANNAPVIKVFSGRTTVEFGRLDEDRAGGVGPILPTTTAVRPGTAIPLPVPSQVAGSPPVVWDGMTLCPTAVAGPFAGLPADLNTVVATPSPVDALLPAAGADATNRWANPGRTCVWALTADADGDALATKWEFPGPIYGSGTFYAAVNVPVGFHGSAPEGIVLGAFINTTQQLEAYNAWVSALDSLAGVPPAIVWEAWDDPCPPGSGDVQNPCPSDISRGGVENIVANTTDSFSLPPRTGYAPIAVLPEGETGAGGDCDGVYFISSMTPNPSDPGPDQDVNVKAMVSPIIEGCVLSLSIVGTDGYANSVNIPTNKSGEATLFIPGGAEGVVDVVTAAFCSPLVSPEAPPAAEQCTTATGKPGRWVVMEVTYTF